MTTRMIDVECTGIDDFGRGIVHIDKETLFLDNLLPGEKARVRTYFAYGKLDHAEVLSRLNSSPERVKPICPYYPCCGGCQIQHLSYKSQLLYKQQKVKDLLHKFAHLDIEVQPVIGLPDPTRFRNKVQKPVRYSLKDHKLIAGFFERGTHELVDVKDCLMESELSNAITNTVLSLLGKYGYRAYDEDRRSGYVRHILIKTSSLKEALVTIVVTDPDLPGRVEFAKELIRIHPEVRGVVFNVNPRKTNVILGYQDVPIYGLKRIHDTIFGKTFLISSQSFYQTNTYQIETLYGKAIEFASLQKTDTVLDAYCGTGTIGLSLSDKVKSVVGVEIVKDAVHDAILNAKNNGVTNTRFVLGDCTEYMMNNDVHFDVVVMDPPRKGSTPEFIDAVKKVRPRTVVYVSCDPVTLARDLALFGDTYQVEKVQPVDMFPNSMHVETVVCLSQRKSDETIKVEVDGDALPVTKAETKATYDDIQKYVFDKYGVKVSSLDISRVKTKCGIKERKNYNLSKSNYYKQPNITDENERIILEALKSFKMIG